MSEMPLFQSKCWLLFAQGNRGNYEELVGHLLPKQRRTADQVALLVTTLKALSGAVSYIDIVHHETLIFAVSRLSMWNYGTDVMDALLELIISLAASNGKYVDLCLDMLVRNFVPPPYFIEVLKQPRGITRKYEVLSRVHAALKDIADLVPLAPMRLSPIVVQKMPNVFSKEHEIVIYVENMLRLESGAIGEIVGVTMLPALVDRMIELDVEIGWDGNLQDEAKDLFDMELEDVAEPVDDYENDDMLSKGSLRRKCLQGNLVAEKLDSLMVLTFEHLESCQSSGRLAQVFDVLLTSFQKTVLNAYKSKFTQFVMFYACALDPEECGVKFATVLADLFISEVALITRMSAVAYLASYLSRAKFLSAALVISILQRLLSWCYEYTMLHDVDMNPLEHQVFYSGCQAIMYLLCFRMRSLMDVPRLKIQLLNMPIEPILKHKLSPLTVCLPTVVEEFLRQAKAAHLFTTSESFVFNDLLESDISRAFGGMDRLDMFFPFDPCLLKKSDGYIHKYFIYWSMVRTTYDSDDISDEGSGSESENDDAMMMGSYGGKGLDIESVLNRMSITPKSSLKYGNERMPSRIRPSTSPESL
ncbi:uncharacterized protein LOC129284426 isoform X2 [Prosopis cineraria]|uniref:uncharacterized protein LOC129284426 isoform X2 n=1 Tax=Prosopis cineraria TaxID=364024 RepID=UPI00241045C8|nr:uncharacterized protein LOC129284426 isoform X2 [Prosopis cineraria]